MAKHILSRSKLVCRNHLAWFLAGRNRPANSFPLLDSESSTDDPHNIVPGSDLVLADCVRFWPNGSSPKASMYSRIIWAASGQCFPPDLDRMRIGSGMFTGYIYIYKMLITSAAPTCLPDLLELFIPSSNLRSSAGMHIFRIPNRCNNSKDSVPFLSLVLLPGTISFSLCDMLRLCLQSCHTSRLTFSLLVFSGGRGGGSLF